MLYSQLLRLLKESGLSPEQSGKRLDVSGMTIRRWRSKPAGERIAPRYARAFEPVLQEMADEGLLPSRQNLKRRGQSSVPAGIRTAASGLGFPASLLTQRTHDSGELLLGLAQIGSEPEHQETVFRNRKRITAFTKFDGEWKRTITGVLEVVRAKKSSRVVRMVAIGVLFYLLMPNDIIPDYIPTFGYLDDFAILQLALAFSLRG